MINLISDTITRPTPPMIAAMFKAEVGDDVFKEDPTINRLEKMAAEMFAHEAALFCPSGTMTNQIALKMHTRPLDEVICDEMSHIFQYEVAGYAFHSGIGVNLLRGENGILTAKMVEKAIKPKADWLPISRLVVLENTCNKGGGSIYALAEVEKIRHVCQKHQLALHLDGARIFNAIAESGESTETWGKQFDSVSICLSKGLGAPVGSLLIGEKSFISEARRVRKAMGGGMRQAGYLAAAGLFALENNVERLKIDHENARKLAKTLESCAFVKSIRPVQTNILIFDLADDILAIDFLEKLKIKGVLAVAFGAQTVRFVTHLDVSNAEIEQVCLILSQI